MALEGLGLGSDAMRQHNPSAVIVSHDAYGWSGPWAARRGFDSLVQMSCGIAWRGREVTGAPRPTPLPAQALDHATGYLIAAAACRGLTQRIVRAQASEVRLSLARTAQLLMELADLGAIVGEPPPPAAGEQWLEDADSGFGRVRRVRCPGRIEGAPAAWRIPAGALGVDAASFSSVL
jgi:crotonobetainyl-CoA:carnitine CoA-transferase CaiB-like acyl-CoA transferase